MQITPGLYAYPWQGRGNNCNSYLLASDVLTLVDPGHIADELNEPCLEVLKQSMARDGFRLEDVDLVLLTHAHPDHATATGEIKKLSGANIAGHQAEIAHVATMARYLPGAPAKLDLDIYLEEGELTLGSAREINLEVYHVPGHSPGSLAYYWPQAKALLTGDVIFAGSIGRTDFPDGSLSELARSVERLASLDVEWLLPGHMQIVKGKNNVRNNIAYIKAMFFGG